MKIEIYDLHDKITEIRPTYRLTKLNKKLKEFAERNWRENHKGWKSSFIPVAERFISIDNNLTIEAGYSNYAELFGTIKAILDKKDFAPEAVNGLAVGSLALTLDEKIILPRRSDKIKHAPLVYNNFAGWMSSMNIDKSNCENPKFITDPRLYDSSWQAQNEFQEESRISSRYLFSDNPTMLVRGLKDSFNLELVYSAIISYSAAEVIKIINSGQKEFAAGRKEHDKIAAVPVKDIEQLLRNQPELQKEDERTFKPSDVTELILLDVTIGILYHEFERLTKNKRPKNLLDDLRKGGIEIVYKKHGDLVYSPL